MNETYKGYTLTAYEQVMMHPFKPFVCMARQQIKNRIIGFNKEGNTLEEAILKCKEQIDENDDA